MDTLVNEKVIASILDDNGFNAEIKALLNEIIDDELLKNFAEMDCDLIDECTQMLIELEQGNDNGFSVMVPLISSEKIIKACEKKGLKNLNRGIRVALVAGLIVLSAFSANTAIAKIFDYNIAEALANSISQRLEEWGIIDGDEKADDLGYTQSDNTIVDNEKSESVSESDTTSEESLQNKQEGEKNSNLAESDNSENKEIQSTRKTDTSDEASLKITDKVQSVSKATLSENEEDIIPVAIRLEFSEGFKTEYLWGEPLNTEGLTVIAVYDGGNTGIVSTADCTFTGYNKALEGTQKIVVTYKGVGATFEITLRKTTEKSERNVTGVQGSAPTKLVYKTTDTEIELNGLSARAVYSDGTFSGEYDYKSAVILTPVDFGKAGEQQVTVRFADLFDYTFTIIIEEIEFEESTEFNKIKTSYKTYHFYLNEEPDYSNIYIQLYKGTSYYKSLKYDDIKDEAIVIGVDTSEQTLGNTKSFTIYYKGYSASARYMVEPRNMVTKAEFDTYGRGWKFLYYYGEPLCMGTQYPNDNALMSLKSSRTIIDGSNSSYSDILVGDSYYLNVYYSGGNGQSCEKFVHNQLDFYGYDPYTLGYQSIDVFREGVYVTTMTVFVYGDEGYAPSLRPTVYTPFSSINDAVKTGSWFRCLGDGGLTMSGNIDALFAEYLEKYPSYNQAYKEMSKDPMFNLIIGNRNAVLEDDTATGWQNASVNLPTGEVYSYKVCLVHNITEYSIINPHTFYKIHTDDFSSKNFESLTFKLTDDSGNTFTVPASETNVYYYQRYDNGNNSEISPDAHINSMFIVAKFVYDRTSYAVKSPNAASFPYQMLYVYSDGYEDAYNVELIIDPSKQDTFLKGCDKDSLIDRFRIHTYDNYFDIFDPIIEGIDCNTVGEYDVTFSVDFDGELLSANRTIYIVDKFADCGLKIITDPNVNNSLMPGDELNIDNTEFTYTDKRGNVTQLTGNDIEFEITLGGSGHIIDSDLTERQITVKYSYINEYGCAYSCEARYTPWGYMNNAYYNIGYSFVNSANAVRVYWNAVDNADYYIVTYLGETYVTTDTFVFCDKNLRNGKIYNEPVKIRPVIDNGESKIIGCGGSVCKNPFTIDGYVPPEETIGE
ncbi:MAG: bacterial Ig-like domain-containing protein [Eubacteriales bacterium]|nr:bacterial Ig-like domain-containing protein [Eubacteriales bacterium]